MSTVTVAPTSVLLVLGALVAAVALAAPRPRPLPRHPAGRAAARGMLGRGVASLPRRRASVDPARAIALLEAFAAELRAGRAVGVALRRAAESDPDLVRAALGTVRLGGDVAVALEQDATRNRLPVLRRFAACWRVGEGTGAGLADAVDRLVHATREAERTRLELRARTAEPRATMRVLAALPAAGVALGALLGADTLGWLLGTVAGRVLLVAGIGLDLFGLLWARRIVASVESRL